MWDKWRPGFTKFDTPEHMLDPGRLDNCLARLGYVPVLWKLRTTGTDFDDGWH